MQRYVKALYKRFNNRELLYHNLHHTQTVISLSYEIAVAYSVQRTDPFTLFAATWFHNARQLLGPHFHHEESGVIIMEDYLEGNAPAEIITSIDGCIMATKIVNSSHNLLEEIICDADTYNLAIQIYCRIQL